MPTSSLLDRDLFSFHDVEKLVDGELCRHFFVQKLLRVTCMAIYKSQLIVPSCSFSLNRERFPYF